MMEPHAAPDARRRYRRPEVRVYGDLRTVTLTSLTNNMNDPGNSSTTRT